ncbi:hypothetical protein L3Y34_001681 [Caenorhabditis briggsae]|uniref:Uncharacterized protein n=1 Tax=Caenorhabditis briggsae TaxID=6238 RepID=A0AAE9DCX1_CAEBR|nr:hypothetical protein L3Y34_001681 [Caenorhabditis briggsae]
MEKIVCFKDTDLNFPRILPATTLRNYGGWADSDEYALDYLSSWDSSEVDSKNNVLPVERPLLLSPKPHEKVAEIGDSSRSQIATK